MAAVVENTDNGQIGNNLTYSQSSGGSLHSLETVLDPSNPSVKAGDFSPRQKVNGLSHVDEDPQLQTTGANILGPGTVKADPQHTLINCSVIKTEIDFGEKLKTEEVVIASDMEGQPTFNQVVQNKILLPEVGSNTRTKDEEKVKLEVPFDSKSNCSLSTQNAENKLSLCDVDGTKEFWVSGLEEQNDEINSVITDCKTTEQLSSSKNINDQEMPLISENQTTIITSTLEDKNLQSNFNDNKLFKSVENISLNGNMDSIHLLEEKTMSSKSATDHNATLNKNSNNIAAVADEEKPSEETNLKNSSESSNFQNYSECLSNSKMDKSPGVSNIPELLAYCSPCQVVVQDFFKELNIDLLELSRNFPVHHTHRKRLKNSKTVPSTIPGKEKFKNNSFDSLDRTKQAKCYTENSKRRKKHSRQELTPFKDPVEDEDEEDNLPLLSVRNNLTQTGNTAADTKKSGPEEKSTTNDNKTIEGENLKSIQTKGDNSDALATEERSVTKCISSDLLSSTSTNAEAANSFQKMSVINVSPTVNISDSNDLGLKIVSVSSQGSVFFPAFTSDNSENIVFNHSDTTSKLNGQLDATCENSTAKLSPPKCKFHGPNSSPVQNLYKCKKCGLEAKSLSDIQAHMAGSHSEFCMYRCPFCIPPLPVKRVGIFNNRPIEFEVLRESSRKLTTSTPSTKTGSSSMSSKRKMPRHIRIQCEKRRKLNYYYRNQREIKKYKNEK